MSNAVQKAWACDAYDLQTSKASDEKKYGYIPLSGNVPADEPGAEKAMEITSVFPWWKILNALRCRR